MIFSEKIVYRLYFIFICLTYLLGLNIIPLVLQKGFTLLWVFALIFLLISSVKALSERVETSFVLLLFLIFMYFICLSISKVLNFGLYDSLMFSFLYGFCYFSLFIVFYNLKNFLKIHEFFKPFVFCSIIIVLISLLIYAGFQPNFYFSDQEQLDRYIELKFGGGLIGFSGAYLNQNSFSIVLLMSIISIYVYTLTISEINKIYLKILYVFLGLSVLFLFLTISRGAILSLAIILLLYLIKGYRSKSSFLIFFMLIILSVIVYLFFYQYVDFFINRIENDGTSNRTEIWADAFNVFSDNMFFGVGDYRYMETNGVKLSAHNVYIHKLASEGIFSSFFWFSSIMVGIYYFFKKYLLFTFKSKVDIFLICSFLGIVVHQFFENTIASTVTSFAVFFIMLLILISSNKKINL